LRKRWFPAHRHPEEGHDETARQANSAERGGDRQGHPEGHQAALLSRGEDPHRPRWLRGADSIAELCRKEGIAQNLCYRWSKEFLEAGKKRLAGDTAREASSDEVKQLRTEARQLKEALAEVTLENRLLKKSVIADGEDGE
jgi:transposase-like protein